MDHDDAKEIRLAIQDLRADLREIREMIVKTMADPVELVRGLGDAVAKSQGYDRPMAEDIGQPVDLFTDPSTALTMEPENEASEREEELRTMTEILNSPGGWDAIGIEAPPGEFGAGPDGVE